MNRRFISPSKLMILIIGLGNPGKKYQLTRHNIGFQVVEEFAKENNFPKFKLFKELSSLISEEKFNDEKIILAKPKTFMNLSGKAVKSLIKCYNLTSHGRLSGNLWVVHDDIDLPLGKIRIAIGRGAAGHKGVESIIKELGTKNFVRFRIGIQPKFGKPKNPEKFVLQNFNKEEEKIIKEVIKKTTEAIGFALKEGLEKAMSKFNK